MTATRRALAAASLLFAALSTGCITTPLEDRDWVRVESQHYDILTSLGENEARHLAISLERTYATLAYLWGEPIPPAPVRTRVLAFDDRGVGRPFAHEKDRAYLLDRPEGDVVVLRTGGGWEDDGREPLKYRIARRLFARAGATDQPPWLSEGLARLASTLEIRGPGTWLGNLPIGFHDRLIDGHWISFDRMLAATDLSAWPDRDRELFEAEAWALCHDLYVSDARRSDTHLRIAAYRRDLRSGTPPGESAEAALGTGLQRETWQHLTRNDTIPTLMTRVRLEGSRPTAAPAPMTDVLLALADLALAIDAPERARRHADQAAEIDATAAPVLTLLGRVAAREGDTAEAERRFGEAAAAAPASASVPFAWAEALRAQAASTSDPAHRSALLARARSRYGEAIGHDAGLPAAHVGLAATYLFEGEDAERGLAALRPARDLLSGDARIGTLDARLRLAAGDPGAARGIAAKLVTYASSDAELAEARSLLEEIEDAP